MCPDFDEIEKAHMNVLHLFLQILDAGRLRDSCTDQEVFFDQTMIILTTNAGSSIYDDARNTSLDSVPKRTVMQALRTECDAKPAVRFFRQHYVQGSHPGMSFCLIGWKCAI